MNEQQVNDLLVAIKAQTQAQIAQTEAINRLAESNESLCAVIFQALGDDIETTAMQDPEPKYLSGKVR